MTSLNREIVLNTLIIHETLTIDDLAREENLGTTFEGNHLQFLVDELMESGHIHMLNEVTPCTYTITDKGISEGERLAQVKEVENSDSAKNGREASRKPSA